MTVRSLLAVLLLTISGSAGQSALAEDLADSMFVWGDALELDAGIERELERFAADEGAWTEDSAQRLATTLRRRVVGESVVALRALLAGKRDPFVEIQYLEPEDFAQPDEALQHKKERSFAAGIIRTEQLAFFPGETLPPAEALELFVSPAFRMETSSRIERIWVEDGLSCIETKGLWGLLSPTEACNRIDNLFLPELAAEHSQVVANPGGEDYQTVYFKESLKTFVLLPEGLALHYLNYTRSAKLSSLKKKLGRGRIVSSQEEKAAAFSRRLAQQGDADD